VTMPPSGQWPPPQQPPQSGQPQGFPAGPPGWGPPQQWAPQPPPNIGRSKWILGGLAVLVVVVLTVVTTLLLTRDGSSPRPPTASSPPTPSTSVDVSDIASANDDGPVDVITEDPTCAPWASINDTLVASLSGWSKRDPSIPVSAWTDNLRADYRKAAEAMRSAADQTVALVKLTPHRVMRELYEQSIAYWRAYADRTADYVPADDHLALVATSTANSIVYICSAITYGAASARGPLVVGGDIQPSQVSLVGDPHNPRRYVESPLPVCSEWTATVTEFQASTEDWRSIDANLSASQWTPEQQATNSAATAVMATNAGKLLDMGARSGNPTFSDFAALAAQYRRAYVQAIPTYVAADNDLAFVASQLVSANDQACQAAGE